MLSSGPDALFVDLRAGGAPELARLFPAPDYFTVHIDCEFVADKAALMAAMAAAFRFPAYFGKNWDALLDCLRSLPNEIPAKGYVLAMKNQHRLLRDFPEEMDTFEAIAGETRQFLLRNCKTDFRIALL